MKTQQYIKINKQSLKEKEPNKKENFIARISCTSKSHVPNLKSFATSKH